MEGFAAWKHYNLQLKMKCAVIGCGNGFAQEVISQLLAQGYRVTGVDIDTKKLNLKHEGLQVIEGDMFSEDFLTKSLDGCDVVFSCVGSTCTGWGTVTEREDATKATVEAMHRAGIKKLITKSSMYSVYDPRHPWFMESVMKHLFWGRHYEDCANMEKYLVEKCQDINFVVVKTPPCVNNKPMNVEKILIAEGQFVPEGCCEAPKANVAKVMLDCLDTKEWDRKLIAVDTLKN